MNVKVLLYLWKTIEGGFGWNLSVNQQCYEIDKVHWSGAWLKAGKYQGWEVSVGIRHMPNHSLAMHCFLVYLPSAVSLSLALSARVSCISSSLPPFLIFSLFFSFSLSLLLSMALLFCHIRGSFNILESISGRAKTSWWQLELGHQNGSSINRDGRAQGEDMLRNKANCFQDHWSYVFNQVYESKQGTRRINGEKTFELKKNFLKKFWISA